MHADWTLLPRGRFFKRPEIELASSFLEFSLEALALNLVDAEIELASSFIKFLLDALALLLMLLPVFVLTVLVAIPNALAGRALLEGITLLFASRTQQFGRGGPIFRGGFGFIIFLSFPRFSERHRTELFSGLGCSVLFR